MARCLVLFLCLPALTATADPAARFCDPVTNVCFCSGGWDGAECTEMAPFCEPGFWQACSDSGVCSCTRNTWQHGLPGQSAQPKTDLPGDRRAPPGE